MVAVKGNSLEEYCFRRLGLRNYITAFYCENIFFCSQKNLSCRGKGGAISTLLLLPLKLRSGAGLLPFGASPLVNGSDAKLKLLLPEHRGETNFGKGSNLLVVVLVMVRLLVVVVVTLPMSTVMVFVIFGFRKNIARGSGENKLLLLSLKYRLPLTLLLSLQLWEFAAGAREAATENAPKK